MQSCLLLSPLVEKMGQVRHFDKRSYDRTIKRRYDGIKLVDGLGFSLCFSPFRVESNDGRNCERNGFLIAPVKDVKTLRNLEVMSQH